MSMDLKRTVEALLFASPEPLPLGRIQAIVPGSDRRGLREALEELRDEYEEQGRSFQLAEIGGGWRVLTRSEHSRSIEKMLQTTRRVRLSRAALECLAVELPIRASSREVHRIFLDRVSGPAPLYGGAYVLLEGGKAVAFAVPLDGKGYWDRIKGFIGIASDRRTVTGISFYEQKETPGLGAEIVQPPFRSQFVGKRVAEGASPIGILQVGSALGPSQVHAVTGATQTSTRLEKIINDGLLRWRSELPSAGGGPGL